jgi:hypothetical protein
MALISLGNHFRLAILRFLEKGQNSCTLLVPGTPVGYSPSSGLISSPRAGGVGGLRIECFYTIEGTQRSVVKKLYAVFKYA